MNKIPDEERSALMSDIVTAIREETVVWGDYDGGGHLDYVEDAAERIIKIVEDRFV